MTSQRVLTCTSGLFLSLFFLAAGAAAQPTAPPKPGPEHEQLKYFVGKWTTEGEMKASPFMPAGKFSSSDNCELFNGGFYVVCRSDGKNPVGAMHDMGILGYDAMKKLYSYYGISNQMPNADVSEGKKESDAWVYIAMMDDMSGKKIQGRYTITNLTPTGYTSKFETAPEGSKDWTLVMEGKSTRVGAAPMKPAETKKDSEGPKKSL